VDKSTRPGDDGVLVQREMESWRAPLASIAPNGAVSVYHCATTTEQAGTGIRAVVVPVLGDTSFDIEVFRALGEAPVTVMR
jgi:hypothetical protein